MAVPQALDGAMSSSSSRSLSLDAEGWRSTWSRPPDLPAQAALALAIVLLASSLTRRSTRWVASWFDFAAIAQPARRHRFLTVAAFAAAFLSLGYIAFYLRGGPRAVDAPIYFLQGRALSHGHWSWGAGQPTASFRAGGLLLTPPDRLAGIFPPGFPLLLAFGFLVGAPMLVGPLVAAAVVIATWWLARELALGTGESPQRAEGAACVAAGLSIVCAALRYHTADTLPHGAAAAAVATAMASALRGRRLDRAGDGRPLLFAASGLALGMLVATEPRSAIAVGAIVLGLSIGCRQRIRSIGWAAAAALPGVIVLLAANRAAGGRAFASPASAYFVLAGRGPGGFSTADALARTIDRLGAHLFDVANFEPLALLPLVALFGRRRARPSVYWAPALIVGQLLAYGPVASEVVGPGAGASILADVLPIDHALIALALVRVFPNALGRAATALLGFAIGGFAVHAAYAHDRLATSDIGRPRFEPDVPRDASVNTGLLFFDNDAGFELAHDPDVAANRGLEAVRLRGDDHDRLIFDWLGRPPTHRYMTSATGRSTVPPWSPGPASDFWRFESESEWLVSASGGLAEAQALAVPTCVSGGHAVVLTPAASAMASVRIELPMPRENITRKGHSWIVTPRVIERSTGAAGELTLVTKSAGPTLAHWSWSDDVQTPNCRDLSPQVVDVATDGDRYWLVLQARRGAVALDRTTLQAR